MQEFVEVLCMRDQYFAVLTDQGVRGVRKMKFFVEQGHEKVF